MDPRLTDEEIIATFIPIERQFYEWLNSYPDSFRRDDQFWALFDQTFPHPEALDQYLAFTAKWYRRHMRRMSIAITRDEFITRLRATNCKDKAQLLDLQLWMSLFGVPDMLFGTSNFGGTMMRYALQTSPNYLFPDTPFAKTVDANSGDTLDRIVLAVDIDIESPNLTAAQPTLNLPQDPQKRRRENVSSGEDSTVSMRSAESDDFRDQKPFTFLQIGSLVCRVDEDAPESLDPLFQEPDEPEYETTGYGVVIRLNDNGYPTGPVFIVYKYQEALPPVVNSNGPSFWQESQWRDRNYQELPEIRRLYPSCEQKFFLGRIAENLSDLNDHTKFDIYIVSEQRKMVITAKRVGTRQDIIPSEIMAVARQDDFKRVRGDTGIV